MDIENTEFDFIFNDASSKTTKGISELIKLNSIYQTEGIRYAGSKRTLIPFIHQVIRGLSINSVLDGFGGSTRVSQFFKKAGYSVHVNDLAVYTSIFAQTYITNTLLDDGKLQRKIDYLNGLKGKEGFYTENYAGVDKGDGLVSSKDGKKKPFLMKNAMKIDAIRPEIDKLAEDNREFCILLTSLILGLDRIENTLGHQVAYLSAWAPRAYSDLKLELPNLISGNQQYTHSQMDVLKINKEFDLAYFDPPYNTNNLVTVTTRVRYASYYHFWTTLVKNDNPELVGAANRRLDLSSDRIPGVITPYENTKLEVVSDEFKKLITSANAKYVLISYSNKGKLPIEDLVDLMKEFGSVTITRIDHKENVQKNLTINRQWLGDQTQNFEFLLLLTKH
jgi:adenine-specific DNA-methyltransferase